jgi:hypothetical protein
MPLVFCNSTVVVSINCYFNYNYVNKDCEFVDINRNIISIRMRGLANKRSV